MKTDGYFLVDLLEAEIPPVWFHMVLEFIEPDSGFIVYIDGQNKGSTNSKTSHNAPSTNGKEFVLGRGSTEEDGHYFTGSVDEILFWESGLSDAEILCLSGVTCL